MYQNHSNTCFVLIWTINPGRNPENCVRLQKCKVVEALDVLPKNNPSMSVFTFSANASLSYYYSNTPAMETHWAPVIKVDLVRKRIRNGVWCIISIEHIIPHAQAQKMHHYRRFECTISIIRLCFHVLLTSPFLWAAPLIFLMDTLTDRMGSQPILLVKVSVIIDTMLNFDSDFDGHGEGDVTC